MSAVALQDAIVAALLADTGVADLVGERVYDSAPAGVSYPYITLGPSQAVRDDADCVSGAEHSVQIDAWTQDGGSKRSCKRICAAVESALHDVDLALDEPFALVLIEVENWEVSDDPEEFVAHGIINIRALVEG
jgi:hypothetical protein